MDGGRFDRFTRNFARRVSRRDAIVAAGVLAFGGVRSATANQLTPPTCGASGDVCTLLMGCCEGLTCVTSAINTNYGVCVTGEGGTISVGTTLISPFSENVEQEVAAIAASETSSTTTTTDPQAEREQHLAEVKARKDARRTEQKSRRTTQKTTQQNRRDTQRTNRELRQGPDVEVLVTCPQGEGASQVVTIVNRETSVIVVTQLTSLLPTAGGDEPFADLPDVPGGTSLQLFFGTAPDGKTAYATERIFDDSPLEGVRVTLGSGHVRTACCDQTTACLGDRARRQRKRQLNRQKNRGKNKN
jgi:hypothetical protein